MAFLTCDFKSDVLGQNTAFNAIIPEKSGQPARTLYLLHGLSDDHTNWSRYTSIERYADAHGIAVIMPNAARSFYTDMVNGRRYYTFVTEELMAVAHRLFPLSDRREDRFVAGLSMGGYGAYRIALKNPDKFCAAASLSGVMDSGRLLRAGDWSRERYLILGDACDISGTDLDLQFLVEEIVRTGAPKPRLYQACGTEDFLYDANIAFRDFMQGKGFDHFYEEGPGDHNWTFWDTYIQKAIAFMLS